MIDKRLLQSVPHSMKYIFANVFFQWLGLVANICFIASIAIFLNILFQGYITRYVIFLYAAAIIGALFIRVICVYLANYMSDLSIQSIKKVLRKKIYDKLLSFGGSYGEIIGTAEIVQLFVEGVDQLEVYFGSYIPQFIYAFLAPITLFFVLSFIHIQTALILLICVPMIPISIMIVQKWAKKKLQKYWGQYTEMGDLFLENIQAMTTLKIYQADAYQQKKMDEQAEHFRKATMRVLIMQLNSISIMDLVAYGGTALGIILACFHLETGHISLTSAILIALLTTDYFLPMRLLGSFFHIAMNGMAASKKLFQLLDIELQDEMETLEYHAGEIIIKDLSFGYDEKRVILHHINMKIQQGNFIAIVGSSGSGKSTLAILLMKRRKNYTGSIAIHDRELKKIKENTLYQHFIYVGANSHLFAGTVKENLLMANPYANDEMMWKCLVQCRIDEFIQEHGGLDMVIQENAGNLSGGQAQRLVLARSLLKDADLYIFDEITSNIDAHSEEALMEVIHEIAQTKTVILISHRLANVVKADKIYVLEKGYIVESGTHQELLKQHHIYEAMWSTQQALENFAMEER